MTDTSVIFSILAKDQASQTLNGIGNKFSGLGGQLKQTALGIGAAFAGVQLAGFASGAIAQYRDAAKIGRITDQVLKSTGGTAGVTADQIGGLATKLSNLAGVDDDLIQSGENVLLTFTNVRNAAGKGNDVFDQATGLALDMSTALGTDLQGSVLQLGKALNDPIKGITALQRAGVSFTDAQKQQIATLVKNHDVLGAQKIILGEVKKEFGGAAAAGADPAAKLSVAWGNLQEKIGGQLLPVLTKLGNILMPIIGFIGEHIGVFTTLAGVIGAIALATKAWSIIQLILNAELLASPIGLIIIGVAALAAGLIWVATKTHFFQDVWQAVWGFLKGVGHWFAHDFVGFFVSAWNWIKNAFTTGKNWITEKIATVILYFKGLPGKIKSAFANLGNIIIAPYKWAFNKISDLWNGTVGKLSFSFPSWVPGLGGKGFSMPKLPHLATGGDILRGGMVKVGERGPETVFLPAQARVLPHGATAAGGRVEVVLTAGDSAAAALLTLLRPEIRRRYAGSVTRALAGA